MLIDQAFLERELAAAVNSLTAAENQVVFCKGAVSVLEQLVKVSQQPEPVPAE